MSTTLNRLGFISCILQARQSRQCLEYDFNMGLRHSAFLYRRACFERLAILFAMATSLEARMVGAAPHVCKSKRLSFCFLPVS